MHPFDIDSIRRRVVSVAAFVALLITVIPLAAQSPGTISGTVYAGDSSPLAGVRIQVDPGGPITISDSRGSYRLTGLPAGPVVLNVSRLGYNTLNRALTLPTAGLQGVDFTLDEQPLELAGLVVSASREVQSLAETPANISLVRGAEIRAAGAAHPSEIMRQVPGAWVSVTGGEGHQTAIRQPLTTSPVYLFLEDGIPTRSTGFFNHNALYEINLPQADRIEVIKGPVTALYGSDAIGGIIDVGTRAPSRVPELELSAEGGSFGWQRFLMTGSTTFGENGVRIDANATRTDGWRDATEYKRQSGTVRWDRPLGDGALRTVATFSNIDQGTAGSSALNAEDYSADPTINYTPISYRTVQAFRLSTEYARESGRSLLSLTPFARWNEMELLANWSLTYDPTVYTTGHRSLGLLAKLRHDFEPLRSRVIAGVDVDYSPGFRKETLLQPVREGRVFTSYTDLGTIYDYDVTYRAVSPYVQAEFSPASKVRLVGGLRYDRMGFDYESALDPLDEGRHRRPADTSVDYGHLSPKLGAAVDLSLALNLFANYGHGFRAPSEGQLFRQGQAVNTIGLDPVKVDSYEGGIRGLLLDRVRYDLSVYTMTKRDDILSFTNPDGSTETVNAGETLHRGVEVGFSVDLATGLRADLAYSRARHTYEEWQPRAGTDFAGSEIETAPRSLANASVTYTPGFLPDGRIGLEWTRVGSYWMDPQNTHKYDGHDLVNVRAALPIVAGISVFGRLMNVTGERYAESSSYTVARGEEFAPGMPRTLYIGIQRN